MVDLAGVQSRYDRSGVSYQLLEDRPITFALFINGFLLLMLFARQRDRKKEGERKREVWERERKRRENDSVRWQRTPSAVSPHIFFSGVQHGTRVEHPRHSCTGQGGSIVNTCVRVCEHVREEQYGYSVRCRRLDRVVMCLRVIRGSQLRPGVFLGPSVPRWISLPTPTRESRRTCNGLRFREIPWDFTTWRDVSIHVLLEKDSIFGVPDSQYSIRT